MRFSSAALVALAFVSSVFALFMVDSFVLRPLSAVISSWFSFNRAIKTEGVRHSLGCPYFSECKNMFIPVFGRPSLGVRTQRTLQRPAKALQEYAEPHPIGRVLGGLAFEIRGFWRPATLNFQYYYGLKNYLCQQITANVNKFLKHC